MSLEKATPAKPHIWRAPDSHVWVCGCLDGKGRIVGSTAATPREALTEFQLLLRDLQKTGMYWEVFP